MTPLVIPVFTAAPRLPRGRKPLPPAPPVAPSGGNTRLVAAVRWDYEYGLLALKDLVHKYRLVMLAPDTRAVALGKIHPEVKAQQNALAWAKKSWRLKP